MPDGLAYMDIIHASDADLGSELGALGHSGPLHAQAWIDSDVWNRCFFQIPFLLTDDCRVSQEKPQAEPWTGGSSGRHGS